MTDSDTMPDATTELSTYGSPTGNAFDDVDQLDAFMQDMRASDTKQNSTADDANKVVEAFAAKTGAGAWPSLDRATVAQNLRELITHPRSIRQGTLNLCGPAAFFQTALGRDPVAVAQFVTGLFDEGTAAIGNLTVSPGQEMLEADYAVLSDNGRGSTQADWMMMGALRNSTNVFWQGSWRGDPDQELAAMTRPEELADWMTQSGIWSSVEDRGRWAHNPGLPSALELRSWEGTDIALLIHLNLIAKSNVERADPGPNVMISNDILTTLFPNHWVVLLNEITIDVDLETVGLTIWTWGGVMKLKAPKQVFIDNYFGAVIAKL